LDLGAPREVAPGISLYHVADPSLLDPAAPVSIWLLRVDPGAAASAPYCPTTRSSIPKSFRTWP
jgi:hypothetical protein